MLLEGDGTATETITTTSVTTMASDFQQPTLVTHFGAPCWTPISLSDLNIPVSASIDRSIVSTE